MKNAEFLKRIRQRMFDLKVSHEKAAACLDMTQPTFSRKLAGKYPFTYEEAEALKQVLGIDPTPEESHGDVVNPRPGMVKIVVEALPEDDQKRLCEGIAWVLEDKSDRLKPEGQEALRALRALG